MTETPIDEIHRIRREISDRFNADTCAIAEDAARRQVASNRPIWNPKVKDGTRHSNTGAISQDGDSSPAAG